MLQLLYIPKLLMRIEARASLGISTRKITMTDNSRLGEELMENRQQIGEPFRLLGGTSVTRQSVLVKSTIIAYAYRIVVVMDGISSVLPAAYMYIFKVAYKKLFH